MNAAAAVSTGPRLPWPWLAAVLVLLALRLPSLVQPAGGDQGLYGYAGQRILAGDVMYRDVWDQKPPAIAFVYAALWKVWPAEAVVPAADLLAAASVAALLILIGRRRFSLRIGAAAAALFLLLGDPYLQRLSGMYVRGQCEPFIALAVAISVVLLADRQRSRAHLVGAGVALAAAFWLKYNAAAYGLTVGAAAWAWSADPARRGHRVLRDLAWIGFGFGLIASAVLSYFVLNGALTDLRLATVDYNLRYSNETYEGSVSIVRYLLTFPVQRARLDPLWFTGGLGALLIVRTVRWDRSAAVVLAWLLAAVLSIAINGSRSLPNYFVQANPALALAASAGLATLAGSGRILRYGVLAVLVIGFWRVGADEPILGWRMASLPGLVSNVRYDLQYVQGEVDRETYLRRFRGVKHDAHEVEALARQVRETIVATDPVFVFGFSGGSVCWKSERASASRFFWSRPVLIGFAEELPGYGAAGLLEDLIVAPPALVALQKDEWRSHDFFMNTDALKRWLESGYVLDYETSVFSVWRPRPALSGVTPAKQTAISARASQTCCR